MGERLLCKQEVVGSIPSASMVLWGWAVVTERVEVRIAWACVIAVGRGVGCAVRGDVFFMDCESGSGASLGAQDVSGDLGGAVSVVGGAVLGCCGRSVTGWHGLSDLGFRCCVSGAGFQVLGCHKCSGAFEVCAE